MPALARRRAPRRGFTLLVVLLVLVAMSALAVFGSLVIREFVIGSSNRIALAKAGWHAFDCAERARAIADRVAAKEMDKRHSLNLWRRLDDSLRADQILRSARSCVLSVRSSGERLDVNHATGEQLTRLLAAVSVPSWQLDSLRDAILDWRDADTVQREHGAEIEWYVSRHREPPRDGPFASARELRFVRGVAGLDDATAEALAKVIDVEPSRIDLGHAPRAVLASLPGLTPEAVDALLLLRTANPDSATLLNVSTAIFAAARDSLAAHYSQLAGLTSEEPDAWILTSAGTAAGFGGRAVIELRLERAGTRVSVVRRREWVE